MAAALYLCIFSRFSLLDLNSSTAAISPTPTGRACSVPAALFDHDKVLEVGVRVCAVTAAPQLRVDEGVARPQPTARRGRQW
eukprot:scaffold4386_cov105-Isochrysis_galbana.AAC.3